MTPSAAVPSSSTAAWLTPSFFSTTTISHVLIADNPGVWMTDCNTTYHHEISMMTRLTYTN